MEPFTALRILVVDDDSEFLEYIVRLFKRSIFSGRYTIETETSGLVAVGKLAENVYDVCLLDQNLGGETGLSVLAKAKKAGCRGAFIILTALEDEKGSNDALLAGVDDYLVKDQVSPSILDRSIRYALQRRQVERITTEQQFRLGHAVKMAALGELAAGIAHEINTPLAIIRGSLFLARKALSSESPPIAELSKKMEVVDQCTDRIASIVKSLKSYAFSDSALRPEMSSIIELIESARDICKVRLKIQGIDFRLSVIGTPPEAIECHPNEVIQVLINLFNNACDALEGKSGAWIEAEVRTESQGLKVLFTDSGAGIPASLREKVLQPYFTTKPRGKGTGLGLSICRTIVQNHGGTFVIDSECPHTRFVFTFPFRFGGSVPETSQRPYVVMLVEDEPEILSLLRESIEAEGVRVLTASDGADAMRQLVETSVDLVVTDINMPEISGIQLVQELETRPGALPQVIFVTGHSSSEIRFADPKRGPPEIYEKPIDLQRLAARVHLLARHSRESAACDIDPLKR